MPRDADGQFRSSFRSLLSPWIWLGTMLQAGRRTAGFTDWLDTRSDERLVWEAREFERNHAQGLINLEAESEKFSPIFRMSLAKDICCLSGRAGVGSQAAFLALMGQLEN